VLTRDERVVAIECDSHDIIRGVILKGLLAAWASPDPRTGVSAQRDRLSEFGANSEMPQPSIIGDLVAVIADRKANPPAEGSYVVSLFQSGVKKIRVKVVEEAAEVFEAAVEPGPEGRTHLVKEVADLVFHTLVLLESQGLAWNEVELELARRFGVSGIAEKASRPANT
jgi:phosphoribosyl-ATP pyrophosphohydrolase